MEPPNNLKVHPTIADPQSPTQIASTLLEKKNTFDTQTIIEY